MRSMTRFSCTVRLLRTLTIPALSTIPAIPAIDSTDTAKGGTFNTPLLREIQNLSKLCPVQVGSFYEIYELPGLNHDFNTITNLLNLRIAKKKARNDTIKFAGFPIGKAKEYIELLIRNNITVALADQTGKDLSCRTKMFVRNITRIITPGTLLSDDDFEVAENNFLLCIHVGANVDKLWDNNGDVGLAWVDISTGEFYLKQTSKSKLVSEITKIQPKEVIVPESLKILLKDTKSDLGRFFESNKTFSLVFRDSDYNGEHLMDLLLRNDPKKIVKAQISDDLFQSFSKYELAAGSALLAYIAKIFPSDIKPLFRIPEVKHGNQMILDSTALQALEIIKTSKEQLKKGSLLHTIDKTLTGAGRRLLASRLKSPSMCVKEINRRLDLVQLFVDDSSLTCQVRNCLAAVGDIERCLLRLHYQSSGLNDFLNILKSLETVGQISTYLTAKKDSLGERHLLREHLGEFIKKLGSFSKLLNLSKILVEDVSESANITGFIRDGVSSKLDTLRQKREDIIGKKVALMDHLSQRLEMREFSLGVDLKHGPVLEFPKLRVSTKKIIEAKLKESPGIKVFDSQRSSTTLRCSFDSWTSLYDEIRRCEENISSEENYVLDNACEQIKDCTFDIIECAKCLAEIDVSSSLGILAKEQNYVRPIFTDGTEFEISGGRHPVVEMSQRTRNSTFVKNDSNISGTERLWLLTGANMGGKSTFLRQCAIIIILSQIGAFVPADKVILGVVDRIFCRVGASDDLAANQSTFMVEMAEAATILNEATSKSFVILDEVGRGTSVLDGLSIAMSILYHLHDVNQCRGIFATHYHELAKIAVDGKEADASYLKHLSCYQTSISYSSNGSLSCLYKLKKGYMKESHGIEVAKSAGIPQNVIDHAIKIHAQLKTDDNVCIKINSNI